MRLIILLTVLFCYVTFLKGQTPIPTDLYMSFPLDGNATDVGGYNYSGTIEGGVTATTDRFGNASKAMQFNGTTGYIDIPYATSVGTLDFSISYWANPTSANEGFVFTKEETGNPYNQFRMGSSGEFFGCFSDITMTYGGGLAYEPATDVWSFYTIIRQGASIKLYVNGVYQSALNTAGTINHSNALNYRIGSMYSGTTFFNGKIDDLRMFKHALSVGEIAALYAYTDPPVITSFISASGTIGSTVTITGTGFSTTPANNIVYFGAVRATVSASTTTSITVTVPAGAGSVVPVSVTVNGAIAYSTACSTPTFTLTNSPPLDLVYNRNDFGVGTGPLSVSIGDFNGDGKADLVTANYSSNTVSVLLGDGNGTFATATSFSVGSVPRLNAIGDFNGDGKADIATANQSSNDISVLLGDGTGTFATATSFSVGIGPWSITLGDFNGDGKADLATANDGSKNMSVLLGNGNGTFATAASFSVGFNPWSIALGDFNGDGKADLASANHGSNTVSVLLGNGNGTFATATSFSVGSSPQSIAIGDFNGDGKADLATANYGSNNISVLLGNGNGTFATATSVSVGYSPLTIALGDFNGDGKADLATGKFGSEISVLLGDGTGTFATAASFSVGSPPYSIAIGDFNGDGKADLVSANYNVNTVSVLLNASIAITTQAVTNIGLTTATGNGNIIDLGILNPTAYGVCWNTTGTPTTSDSKVDNGATSTTGVFTASITGLTPNTTYYVRAYATNTAGTSYGNEVNFTTHSIATWTGLTSTDWNTATNWNPNGIPNATISVIITDVTNDPIVNQPPNAPAECYDLTIASGVLTIDAGKALTVNGILTNNSGTGGLVLNSSASGTGSLIHSNAGVSGTVNCYINSTNWADWKDGWHFLSSPVAAQAISPGFTTEPATEYDFYSWYEAQNVWVNYKNTTEAPTWLTANSNSLNFIPGKGYMAAYKTGGTKLFAGMLNKADVAINGLTINGTTATYRSWHLLGNPFPSALTWDATSNWNLTNIAGVVKIWNEANQSYSDLSSSPASSIPATNGFMAQVVSGTGSLTLPASKRVHSAQAFYKSAESGIKLIVRNLDLGNAQESSISINPEATTGFDLMYDGDFLAGYGPQFYSLAGSENLSTNSLPELPIETGIPFVFIPNEGNNFRFEASGFESLGATIWLLDKKTNTDHNLSTDPIYNFTASSKDIPERFLMHFSSLGVNEITEVEQSVIWYHDHQIFVISQAEKSQLEVFDLQGKRILKNELGGKGSHSVAFNYPSGLYVVKLSANNVVKSTKIVTF